MISAKVYVHQDKESNWDRQKEFGLSDEAMDIFKWCAMEVIFDVEINEATGETWATHVNNVPLTKKSKLT